MRAFQTSNGSREAMGVARLTREDRLAAALYLGVTVAVGFVDYRVRPFAAHTVTDYIPGVLAGTYGAPANYRVLAPYLIDAFNRITGVQPLVGFLAVQLVFIYASLVTLHLYLRHWYSASASLGATCAAAALLPLTFTNGWADPDSFPELFLFTLGCLFISRRQDLRFLAVLVLATLNRETAAFLVLLWAWCRLPGAWARADLARAIGYGLIWLTIYVGLRALRGLEHYEYLMLWQNLGALTPLPSNFDPYKRVFGYFWIVLLAVPSGLAVYGGRMAATPAFIKRALPVAATFVVVSFMISRIIESRIFLPMFPLLLPAVLRVFAVPEDRSTPRMLSGRVST